MDVINVWSLIGNYFKKGKLWKDETSKIKSSVTHFFYLLHKIKYT